VYFKPSISLADDSCLQLYDQLSWRTRASQAFVLLLLARSACVMAISSLRYAGHGRGNPETTQKGEVIFRGSATEFHDWEFRTMLRYKSTDDKDIPKTVARIVDALRGDAFQIAQDIGIDALSKEDGIPKLIQAIKDMVFPTRALEAKELYAQGHRTGGM